VNAIDPSQTVERGSAWLWRARAVAAVALLWAGLHFVVNTTVLPRGLERPTLVLVGYGGLVPAIAVLVVTLVGALIAMLLCGRRDGTQGLLIVAVALALWVAPGGTMRDWLILKDPTVGPPGGAAYWPLLAEYVYWGIVAAAVVALNAAPVHPLGEDPQADWRRALGLGSGAAPLRTGIAAMLITTAVGLILIGILTGPRLGYTYRGQVYFAVALAFAAGTIIARRVTGLRRPLWYLPAPLIVGIIGVLWAGFRPNLGAPYQNINIIPVTGLVRPLPVEMIAVGIAAICFALRTARRLSSDEHRR
jgi:hypothetical protein